MVQFSARLVGRRDAESALFCGSLPLFSGKNPGGGDRVPDPGEIANCSRWLQREFALLKPELVIPVGKLAIGQFLPLAPLTEIIGRAYALTHCRQAIDLIPLPHPSGASPWHRIEPGLTLLHRALQLIASHPAVRKKE